MSDNVKTMIQTEGSTYTSPTKMVDIIQQATLNRFTMFETEVYGNTEKNEEKKIIGTTNIAVLSSDIKIIIEKIEVK